jgi:DNA modification methylase
MGQNYEVKQGNALDVLKTIPDGIVQCCVTSPPYWGLRDYGVADQLGLERTPEEYVARIVAIFREVRRVLRDDGTLWLNLGDSYAPNWSSVRPSGGGGFKEDQTRKRWTRINLAPKQLVGIPWRVAFALQADGWWLRQDIVWSKSNPMPESVTDRCTKSHEYIFLLAKADRYYFDAAAVKEEANPSSYKRYEYGFTTQTGKTGDLSSGASYHSKATKQKDGKDRFRDLDGRNRRSVWTMATQPFPGAHFATFPEQLPELCIRAGSGLKGCCPKCRKPWERVIQKEKVPDRPGRVQDRDGDSLEEAHGTDGRNGCRYNVISETKTWVPGCQCDAGDPVPCTVLDPFCGSGTTGAVALLLGQNFIGIELNEKYVKMSLDRMGDVMPMFAQVASQGT